MATNGNSTSTPGSVYLTRDCIHFRSIKSPVSTIAARFFSLLSTSSEARRCFAHSLLDHALDSPSQYTSQLDAELQSYFTTSPPTIVLIQGPFRVDFINESPPSPDSAPGSPKSMSTINTMASTMTAHNGGPGNLQDAVFVGYTLHNELNRCAREDKEQYAKLAYFLLATLAHETSHWLFTKVHGYRRDESRHSATYSTLSSGSSKTGSGFGGPGGGGGGGGGNVNISQAGQRKEDPLISFGQMREDSGARSVDMLLGGTGLMVSWADGDTEIVKRKIQPAITTDPPVLSHSAIESLIGSKLPSLTDITGQPPILIGGTPPKWSQHDTYLVTSQTAANSFCPHGMCRIGQLF